MAWLVCDGRVLATLEVATTWRARALGLLGRDGIDGAILLEPAWSVHTLRMRFPIDVAFCDRDRRVLKVVTLPPNRVTRPVLRSRCVVECEAGMLPRWGVRPGTRLEIRGVDDDGRPAVDLDLVPPSAPSGPGGLNGAGGSAGSAGPAPVPGSDPSTPAPRDPAAR